METDSSSSSSCSSRKIVLKVEGMTCMGCVGKITNALNEVDGTSDVDVSLNKGLATINYSGPDDSLLVNAVTDAGKKASLVDLSSPQARPITLSVKGMTCNGCVTAVRDALEGVESTNDVTVDLESGVAKVTYAGDASTLIDAVLNQAGKAATLYTNDSRLIDLDDNECGNVINSLEQLQEKAGVGYGDSSDSLITSSMDDQLFTIDDEEEGEDILNAVQRQQQRTVTSDAITRLRVGGMTCTSCSSAVEKSLLAVGGVKTAMVQVLGGRAKVNHDPDLSTNLLVEAVTGSGYSGEVLETKLPGQSYKSSVNQPFEFRIDFGSDTQAQNACTSLRALDGVDDVKFKACTASVRLHPGHFKSSILEHLERKGGFGKMVVRQSLRAENEANSRGENMGATDVIDEEAYMWKKRFLSAVSFFIMIIMTEWLHRFYGSVFNTYITNWLEFFFATPVQFISGYGFYRASYYSLRKGRATMDVLVSLSTSIAYFSSLIVLLFNLSKDDRHALGHSVLFRVSAMITTMVLLGKWLESTAKRRAAAGVAALSSLKPEYTTVYDESRDVVCHTEVPVNSLAVGDIVRLIPGDKVPTDGEVIRGMSAVDESMLTGESHPVHKKNGDEVIGGTLNGNGSMFVRATAVGEEAVLSQIVALVNDAQTARAPVEAMADRISAVFVPAVVSISIAVFVSWYVMASVGYIPSEWYEEEGKFFFSLLFALETMVIACPCALGLATPTAVMVASEVATKNGVLFRGGAAAVEAGSKISTVVFDKTGTLTMGKPTVSAYFIGERCGNELDHAGMLLSDLIYLVETESHHPLASAIRDHIKSETNWPTGGESGYYKLSSLPKETPGRGIEATVNKGEYKVQVGSPIFVFGAVDKHTLFSESELQRITRMEKEQALTIVIGVVNNKYGVVYGIKDTIRPEAASVIREIHDMGMRTALVTGDSSESGRIVGQQLGIALEDIHMGATPEEKVMKVKEYEPSCFVGDGVNDAIALTGATVGVAIGAGAPVAAESAPVVLVRPDLWGVIDTLDLSRVTLRRVHFNFFWAVLYNLLSVPVAAGVLYPVFRVRVPPMIASGAMALSSTCVIISSLGLRWYKPKERTVDDGAELTEVKVSRPAPLRTDLGRGSGRLPDPERVQSPLLRSPNFSEIKAL